MEDGLHKAHRVDSEPILFRIAEKLNWDKKLVACVLCELVCTTFLTYGGHCINIVERVQAPKSESYAFNSGVAFNWGLWLLIVSYLGSQLSGPHCNPAVTFLFYALDALPLKHSLLYMAVQFIGCYLGSLFAFLLYFVLEAINKFDGGIRQVYGPNATADLFATFPKSYLSLPSACADQFITTAVLCFIVLGITDERNKIPKMAQPAIIGAALWGVVNMFALNSGAALNPARDLSPRLMSLTVGYGWEVFSYNNYTWFWIPIVWPFFGALFGGFIYKNCLGDYLPHNTRTMEGFHRPSVRPSIIMDTTLTAYPSTSAMRSKTVCNYPLFSDVLKSPSNNRISPSQCISVVVDHVDER